MCLAFTVTAEEAWPALARFGLLLTQRLPVLLIWQVLMLAWFLLRVKKLDPRKAFTLHREETAAACLAGLGLGLGAIFIISIESTLFPSLQAINAGTAGAIPIAEVVFLVFSISLLPWAGEQYFRGILFDFLDNRLGGTGAIFLSSLLFSLLSFRLNLVLPGLLGRSRFGAASPADPAGSRHMRARGMQPGYPGIIQCARVLKATGRKENERKGAD